MTLPAVRWRGEDVPVLVLGTAQLGLPGYGVANRTGGLTPTEADAVVAAAWAAGGRFFDTAQAYGDSEERLGRALARLSTPGDEPRIITKLAQSAEAAGAVRVGDMVETSLEKLGRDRLWGLLLHRFSDLSGWESGLGDSLRALRAAGKIQYLGVSVYTADEAQTALAHPDMDVVQVPANAWDDQMIRAGVFEKARRRDKFLFVRSVFLQGLLLLDPEAAEARVAGAGGMAAVWRRLCEERGIPPLVLALQWAAQWGWPLVVGAETPDQVAAISRALARPHPGKVEGLNCAAGAVCVPGVLDPRAW